MPQEQPQQAALPRLCHIEITDHLRVGSWQINLRVPSTCSNVVVFALQNPIDSSHLCETPKCSQFLCQLAQLTHDFRKQRPICSGRWSLDLIHWFVACETRDLGLSQNKNNISCLIIKIYPFRLPYFWSIHLSYYIVNYISEYTLW